jgi:hypothetical protein
VHFYTVRIESFHIDNTRSRHNDTDTVTFGVQVGDTALPVLTFGAGDVNNGDHGVNLHFGAVLSTDSQRPLALTYSIYNGSVGELSTNLNNLAKSLLINGVHLTLPGSGIKFVNLSGGTAPASLSSAVGLSTLLANTSDWYVAVAKVIAETAIKFVFPNCDGFVAADVISMTTGQWDEAIDGQGGSVFRATMPYPGSNSPDGCGSNSSYNVTWSVTRETVTGSLRQFLAARKRSAAHGIRALAVSAVTA